MGAGMKQCGWSGSLWRTPKSFVFVPNVNSGKKYGSYLIDAIKVDI